MIYCNKGVSHKELGDFDSEIECYKKIWEIRDGLELSPFFDERISTYFKQYSLPPFLEQYELAFKHLAQISYELGRNTSISGDLDSVIIYYKQAIGYKENHKEAHEALFVLHYNKGLELEESKQFEEAIELYKESLKYRMEDNDLQTQLYLRIAVSFNQLNQFQEALNYIEKITWDVDNEKVILATGNMYLELGKYKEADKCFERLLEKNPNDATVVFLKSDLLYQLGQYDESFKYLERAKEMGFKNSHYFLVKSRIFVKWSMYDKALQTINEVISSGIKDLATYNFKGVVLLSLNNKKAIKFFKKAIKCAEENPYDLLGIDLSDLYTNLGSAYYKFSKDNDAMLFYKKAIELNPSNLVAYNSIATLLYSLDQKEATQRLYEQLAKFSESKIVDLSFLDDVGDVATEGDETPSEIQEEIISANEDKRGDDIEYISESFDSQEQAQKLMLEYMSLEDGKIKEDKKNELNFLVKKYPSLENFIVYLFLNDSSEDKITTLEEIFASDSPSLINQFFQHKKNATISYSKIADEGVVFPDLSSELEGLHKINAGENFKANWFFKFTRIVIDTMHSSLKTVIDRINDLHILPEKAHGKKGFKKHEVSNDKGSDFSMLKLVGFNNDDEIYGSKTIKYLDPTGKTHFLTILDQYKNHDGLSHIINEGGDFIDRYVDIEEFQEYLLGRVGDLD